MLVSRRALVAAASLSAVPFPARAQRLSRGVFTHGVASGDPLPDGVILWTRFAGASDGAVGWEIAEDESFARVTQSGEARATLANDFCIKVDARGLAAGRRYFYRFLSASGPSPTGQTRTAPQGNAEALTVGLFSCANFAFGYFHAYGHAAERDDIDLVLHAGDYIYEYRRGIYPDDDESVPGRILDPAGETVRVEDYYRRYATYHTDPDLLELRRLKPISSVWDDHEIANET